MRKYLPSLMGPLVMLIHGWNGRGTQIASFVFPLVEKGLKLPYLSGSNEVSR